MIITKGEKMVVRMTRYPSDKDWMEVKKRALVTVGKEAVNPPDMEWKKKILRARHSPIRYLQFSFYLEVPYWVSVHLCRHVHAQPYIRSQRNDRQDLYDRNTAPQNEPVSMIWDMNAEELITIANKRLCNCASKETRDTVTSMVKMASFFCPEFKEELVPICEREHCCNEMHGCGRYK